jgi:hypothetical protein
MPINLTHGTRMYWRLKERESTGMATSQEIEALRRAEAKLKAADLGAPVPAKVMPVEVMPPVVTPKADEPEDQTDGD